MKLAVAPETITIGKVIRQAEAGSGLVECMRKRGKFCAIEGACGLVAILNEAHDIFFSTLDRYSLADATTNRNSIARLLNLDETLATH